MSVYAFVTRKRRRRKGKGFSKDELKKVGFSVKEALKRGIPIDLRRTTHHEENVTILEVYIKDEKLQSTMREEKIQIIELGEIKGIGPKTAEKLILVGIQNVQDLAIANARTVMKAIGASEKKATRMIKEARSVLNAG